ncbi:MAG: PhoX family phosphatase [Rickettsiales bacterium]|nr:PhoX family phosphatase [Rickettsiales bacterium]
MMTKESYFHTILNKRYSRRDFIKISTLAAASTLIPYRINADQSNQSMLSFPELTPSKSLGLEVAKGYESQTLLSYNDPLSDTLRFGYNNDFNAYLPIDGSSEHGLLCTNHEYTNTNLMFSAAQRKQLSFDNVTTEMKAHGHSVVEIKKENGRWNYIKNSRYNKRIDMFTKINFSGAAAGNERLKTQATESDWCYGTLNNCGGGKTPWGTLLTAEENFDKYFSGSVPRSEAENYHALGIDGNASYQWHTHYDRFNMDKDPNTPITFGWVVEIDPYKPDSTPVKHTALGRFKHEAATCVMSGDNRLVVYMGDDERFECVYKFVSETENSLTEGTLYCAEFKEDGTLYWHALSYGTEPLTPNNGFHSQADILIETRKAAHLLGATKMDRPEDIEVNPINNKVYAVMTNNHKRKETNAANPRSLNFHGHIIEITAKDDDHTKTEARWDIFMLADGTNLSCPDNITFDGSGNLWIATDGMPKTTGYNDGLFVSEVSGARKAIPKRFLSAPVGAEVCGPEFTPDFKTLFVSIQHPGEGSDFENPSTSWPEANPVAGVMRPKPSVVAISFNEST